MKCHKGVYLPESEKHLIEMLSPGSKRYMELEDGRPAYQRHKYLAALELVSGRSVFVDVGAHCGLWSMQAEQDFRFIYAFEPFNLYQEIYPRNMRGTGYALLPYGLSDNEGLCSFKHEKNSSGGTHIVPGPGTGQLKTLDSFGLSAIDLLKIDVEGHELQMVKGARETLLRTKPVVVIEQKGRDQSNFGRKRNEALDFLIALGMRQKRTPLSGDYFLGW